MKQNHKINLRKKKKSSLKKRGLPPGTPIYTGIETDEKVDIKIIDYNKNSYKKQEYEDILGNLKNNQETVNRWIDIQGINNQEIIEVIGKEFNLHPLLLEDILNPIQRPKYEDYGDLIFITLKKLIWDNVKENFDTFQISILLTQHNVISIHEDYSKIFDPIYERIIIPRGRIRNMGPDYLLYALIDLLIDDYFIVQEKIGEIIENIEDILVEEPQFETLQSIYKLKRQTIDLRNSIWPLREVVNNLQREQSSLINDDLQYFIRDLYDHIFRINDSLQTYRDIISGMLDMYLSSVSNKMNEIMKVLTIIATIFIPLTFLAGVYGMNFAYMPELQNPYGYSTLIIIMGVIGTMMLFYFRKKKWI